MDSHSTVSTMFVGGIRCSQPQVVGRRRGVEARLWHGGALIRNALRRICHIAGGNSQIPDNHHAPSKRRFPIGPIYGFETDRS